MVRLLVNGQTGKVNGSVPTDWIKVTILVLAVLAVVGLGVLIVVNL